MTKPLDETLQEFMGVTAKSTVAVVVPLYGFWGDIPDNPADGEVLRLCLGRLYSNVHHLYIIFVAHPESLPNEAGNPNSVTNILIGRSKMGNVKNIPVPRDATYVEHVVEGIDAAIHETNAQFIMVFNPWTMIQEGAVDVLIDRCNRADDAKVVSGFDLRSVIEPENLDSYKNTMPSEEYDISFNFLAMPRFVAEMINFDPDYLTHALMERDIAQQVTRMGYAVIASQRIPIFPLDFPWNDYEQKGEFEADRAHFTAKWQFDPGILYQDTRGAARRDRTPEGRWPK